MTTRAGHLSGLRSTETRGKNFLNLDLGLPVEAVNRRGKPIMCRVTCSPLLNADDQIEVVILVMEAVENSRQRAETVDLFCYF